MSSRSTRSSDENFRQRHRLRKAQFHTYQGGVAVREYEGQTRDSVAEALKKSAVVELPQTGIVEVFGADAARLLQLTLTQEISSMFVGEASWSTALNRHGRMLQSLRVWRRSEDRFILLCPPNQEEALIGHLSFHLVTEDVSFSARTAEFSHFLFFGERIAPTLGIPHHNAVAETHQFDATDAWSIPGMNLGVPCRDILTAAGTEHDLINELERRGASLVGTSVFDGLRVASGTPLWGVDAKSEHFPNESGHLGAMNFSKGCYLGQEIVNRIFQLGPRTQLMGIRFHSTPPPSTGPNLVIHEGPIVEATTIEWCSQQGFYGALAIIPTDFAKNSVEVSLLGHPDEVVGNLLDLPFS